ncbi:MAG: NADH dehydrogenase [Kosmotoga sp.]|uniref:complex I subunit 5 family protein n=1 Tax=Kosmotoga sp. TaxID=1955248 RepID=UPI001DFA8744|nr:complex I subunit 5 family protein [Kosmotoga sp.]MBO8167273.1 NADH dehydrogenase [Kosmotoga sp.]MCD6159341.1 NADH dehydrogenase [Kosmotoga sp.]
MEAFVNVLSFMIIIPLIAALMDSGTNWKVARWLNVITCSYLLVVSFILWGYLPLATGLSGEGIFSLDEFSYFALLFANILGLAFSIYLLKSEKLKFHVYFIMTMAFVNGALMTQNAVAFLVFWGLAGLMLYLFAISSKLASGVAKKTLIISGISDSLLIFAFFLLGYSNEALIGFSGGSPNAWEITALSFIVLASFAKAGAFPLHTWIPEYCEKAPIESAFILPASLDKILGIYLLARLFLEYGIIPQWLRVIVAGIGAFTIIIAVMMALIQHNARKLLGYHAVSQVGYMVLGIATGNPVGIIGGLLHTVNNSIYKSGLFMAAGNVESSAGTVELAELGGLARRTPLTFSGMLVCSLSISGMPLTNGFVSKWLIYQGVLIAMAQSLYGYKILYMFFLIMALFGSALTLASFMKLNFSIFLGKATEKTKDAREASLPKLIALLINASLCLFIGIGWKFFPLPLIENSLGKNLENSVGFLSTTQLLGVVTLSLVFGALIYLMFRKVRVDDAFVGGQKDTVKFRISGTGFFNDIRNMKPLKVIYNGAEKGCFDIYTHLKTGLKAMVTPLKLLHTGELSFYSVWVMLGFIVLLSIFLRGG